jgi:LysM repeat protein
MRTQKPKSIVTLVASLFIFLQVFSQKEKERIANYIEQYKGLAISEMIRTGIPASITLAQGLLETGYGQSELAVNANNHFGIKCKTEWTGEKVYHDDDAKGECFRKYASVEDSYKDHSEFLATRPHYAFLFKIDPTDYQGWAHGLKKAGYATNPAYGQRLIKFIEDNDLNKFTLLALEQMPGRETLASVKTWAADSTIKNSASIASTKPSIEISTAGEVLTIEKNPAYPKGQPFTINTAKVLYADAGTSLLAIASNYNVAYNRLLDFNELQGADILEKEQLIFLERKQKKGTKEVHIVEAGETLHEIAQKEGVQLSSILEYNRLTKGSTPEVGQKLSLKPSSTKLAAGFTTKEGMSSM